MTRCPHCHHPAPYAGPQSPEDAIPVQVPCLGCGHAWVATVSRRDVEQKAAEVERFFGARRAA